MKRSEPFCEGSTDTREQFNAVTSFVDASNVYGSTITDANVLRTHRDGLMKVGVGGLLPNTNQGLFEKDIERTGGDVRAIEAPPLTTMHTVWLREHNRIGVAPNLQYFNPLMS